MESPNSFSTLRFVTCGSVDDGKSTLIGRLLYESQLIFDDELRCLKEESRQYGTQGDRLDLALLVDGLLAEREQGITIDVAYRYFATPRRRFVVADSPGHEQYTRNMATGASTAQLALILVDARKGVLTQTRRHIRIAAMMGIRHVILAINKMDLVYYSQETFSAIARDCREFAAGCGFFDIRVIPISALEGDNVVRPSTAMPWYRESTLIQYLEEVETSSRIDPAEFRMPVQWINRPNPDFRGVCGRIITGKIEIGDRVCVMPSGAKTRIERIVDWGRERREASAGDSVALIFVDNVDVGRGDVITGIQQQPPICDQFLARVLWMSEHDLVPGRSYLLKLHCMEVTTTITSIQYREDINSGAHLAAPTLSCNDIGVVELYTAREVVFEPYVRNRNLGGFIIIDRLTSDTLGAGMIECALASSSTIPWQTLSVDQKARALQKKQQARCIWFTGLSGSGKSTIANVLDQRLFAAGRHTYILDGDNVRHGLNRDLGFAEADRVENIRRVAEVARLMVDAGLIVLVSFIAPFREERQLARDLFEPGQFIEVFVDAPLAVCERRDPKGLYAKARCGKIRNFTGIDSPYETPQNPEVHLKTAEQSVSTCVESVFEFLD